MRRLKAFWQRAIAGSIIIALLSLLLLPAFAPSNPPKRDLGVVFALFFYAFVFCDLLRPFLARSEMTMADRKKPGVAFWATVVLVGAMILYPLSMGPAYWMVGRIPGIDAGNWFRRCDALYTPVWIATRQTHATNHIAIWYMNLLFGEVGYEREAYRREVSP